MLQYSNINYQGIEFATTDLTNMQYLHMDVWTANLSALEIFLISRATGEKSIVKSLTANAWTSINIPLADFVAKGMSINDIFQFKLVGATAGTVFIDNIYFYKNPTPASGIQGTWKLAPEAGALKVGDSYGAGNWWSNSVLDITTRACLFDDTYVFATNGSFSNVLGTSTWLEAWQGTANACGAPVAPHNGASATYTYNSSTNKVTINGSGAYLGLPKANNSGELPNVAVPSSIVYDVVLSNGNNTMELVIEAGNGVFWSFKLVRV